MALPSLLLRSEAKGEEGEEGAGCSAGPCTSPFWEVAAEEGEPAVDLGPAPTPDEDDCRERPGCGGCVG